MIFNYDKFSMNIEKDRIEYQQKKPYPYAIYDNLFDEKIIEEINKEINNANFKKEIRKIESIEIKIRSDFEDNESLPKECRRIFEVINGGKFLKVLTRLTGVEGLISDPYYDGGGINIIENKGTLAVHVDGTMQRRMQVHRRLNVILFLNNYWDINWNGYHEQWDYVKKELSPLDEMQRWICVRKIYPIKNRLLIFSTSDHSWHGHAGPLDVPDKIQRRSLITYYYTVNRPEADILFDAPHGAIFINNNKTITPEAYDKTEIIY
jgi:hypothetical protein